MTRRGAARGAALALLLAAAVGAPVAELLRSGSRTGEPAGRTPGDLLAVALSSQSPGIDPLVGFGEAQVALGGRCMRVGVADEPSERVVGLRGVESLDPYDGMIFVFASDGGGAFTMADTVIDLDIGFYDSDGIEVDRERMVPCRPGGDDRSCPLYGSRKRYRYALEVPGGALGSGALSGCA